MNLTIEAVYENGVLKPKEPLPLAEHEQVTVTVESAMSLDRRAAAVAMLQRWQEEDAVLSQEETAANAAVLRALDDDRPSYRKLFTAVLRDETP